MKRPGTGRLGTPVELDTNFFPASLPSGLVISQYAVSIYRQPKQGSSSAEMENVASTQPVVWNKAIFRAFLRRNQRALGRTLAYDGRSICFASKEVSRDCLAVKFPLTVDRDGNEARQKPGETAKIEQVAVEIKHANYLKFDDVLSGRVGDSLFNQYLTAVDVVISASHMTSHVQVGRSFYNASGAKPLGRYSVTASAWRGFYQSARLSPSGLLINLDESYTAFWNRGGEPLINLVRDANNGRDLNPKDPRAVRSITSTLKGLKVRAVHTGITYRVFGFSSKGAGQITFEVDGERKTIADYFHSAYGIRLRHPNLPCIKTQPKKETYLPMELLEVSEKQRLMGKLSEDQTRSIVKIASTRPSNRRTAAVNTMKQLNHSNDPVCKDFGIQVKPKMIGVRARVLQTPFIRYTDKVVKPERGAWKAPRDRCHQPGNLFSWAVINTSDLRERDLAHFLKELCTRAASAGINIPNQKPKIVQMRRNSRVDSEMRTLKHDFDTIESLRVKGARLQLIVVIFDRRDTDMYNSVKRTGDIELGVPSQVLLKKNLISDRGLSMFCDNVLLKMNAKIGGGNFKALRYQDKGSMKRNHMTDPTFINYPHIVLGADVTHPMAGDSNPSVAALVGSRDSYMGQFSGAIRNQTGRKEVITELGDMFKEVYSRWYAGFGKRFPAAAIIMFRDGVSEGQFEEVMQIEVAAIRNACLQISSSWKPKITYIIVTKRHHARFFPRSQSSGDRSGNIDPGTVVDTGVVSSQFYDFYLNSHAGIIGTNKPAKYTVLVDENNTPVDALQGYIFRLAHCFQRCSRSVSMVNSAYYAHLLAFRGRAYHKDNSDSGSVSSSHSIVPSAPKFHRYVENILFFL